MYHLVFFWFFCGVAVSHASGAPRAKGSGGDSRRGLNGAGVGPTCTLVRHTVPVTPLELLLAAPVPAGTRRFTRP